MDASHIRDPDPASEQTAPPDLSSAIDRLMAHPELISMVASAMGMGTKAPPKEPDPPKETQAESHPKEERAEVSSPSHPTGVLPEQAASLAPLLGLLSGKGDGKGSPKDDNRACLLRALKPYVSQNRRQAIDTILQVSRLSDLLRHMN